MDTVGDVKIVLLVNLCTASIVGLLSTAPKYAVFLTYSGIVSLNVKSGDTSNAVTLSVKKLDPLGSFWR